MKIAITTPTGQVGRQLVRILQDQGSHELVLPARYPEKLADEAARGARVARGDLSDGEFVTLATAGVEMLFCVIAPKLDAEHLRAYQDRIATNYADAVRENRIERVVLLSSLGGQVGEGTGPVDGLHDAEEILGGAAQNLTVIRPAFYMENFLSSIDGIAQSGTISLPVPGDTFIPMIATRDVALAASRILTDRSWRGVRVIELLGARDYSFTEAARIIGDSIGQKLKFVEASPDEARRRLVDSKVSPDVASAFVQMLDAIGKGLLAPERGRTPESTTWTTLEEFARAVFAPAYRERVGQLAGARM